MQISSNLIGLDPKIWSRSDDILHNLFANKWVKEKIPVGQKNLNLLDVGCGSQPYKKITEERNILYFSHDFSLYKLEDTPSFYGLHNSEDAEFKVNFICDFLDIDETIKYDLLLCTEVLEHVPDPVKCFAKLAKLLKPDGVMIITVPGSSWTHQAPYYFSSGLSPFWFNYHAKEFNLKIIEGVVVGNLLTSVIQSTQVLEFTSTNLLFRFFGKVYRFYLRKSIKNIQKDIYYAPTSQICLTVKHQ
jgi:2-polyprenyl-3-methyl-5-hydroxy-6-metoxy-1,4-benzoquinol methylase